jgi:membrane associated rhomboid family serine protease
VNGRFEAPKAIVFGGPLSPGVRAILFATSGVFVFQLLSEWLAQTRLERLFGLVPYDVTHHLFLWQGVTYLFLHGGFFHILFNMLALWMFGTELEYLWGTSRFVRFYFITGVGAALCSTVVSPNSTVPIIGASGAIYGLLAAYGLLFPERILLLYLVIPIKAKYFVLILGAIAFWFSMTASGGGVAHVAHLGGMLFGWLYLKGLGNWRGLGSWKGFRSPLREWRERRRRDRLRRKFKVYYKKTRGEDEGPEE